MPRKEGIKETVKIEEQPKVEEVTRYPEHNHSFYLHHSDNEFDYWKCSMSSCGFMDRRPRIVSAAELDNHGNVVIHKKVKSKVYEVLYHCRNCGHAFKAKFDVGLKARDTEPCPRCGIDDSRKFIRKPQ